MLYKGMVKFFKALEVNERRSSVFDIPLELRHIHAVIL